jgi:hypothetical protein
MTGAGQITALRSGCGLFLQFVWLSRAGTVTLVQQSGFLAARERLASQVWSYG